MEQGTPRCLRPETGRDYTDRVDSLWSRVDTIALRAVSCGALVSVPTETVTVADGGIPFVVHLTTLQKRKTQARSVESRPPNPFLPPDPRLVVDDLPPAHICVLNKFNVLKNHLLIITKRFEPQESLLTIGDFRALSTCMVGGDGLAFYNGGTIAGASQPHKHLQLVPLPLGDERFPTPVDSVIDPNTKPGLITKVAAFPFAHSLVLLNDTFSENDPAERLLSTYRRACAEVGVHDQYRPYNMILTKRWMMVVPRTEEFWRGVSFNALGFAGSLLVRNRDELEQLKRTGPVKALESVAGEIS